MPLFQVDDVVYSLKELNEPASGDSPSCHLCDFADKLIIRKVSTMINTGRLVYHVSHEHVTDGRCFTVSGNEISYMQHFKTNHRPYAKFGYRY